MLIFFCTRNLRLQSQLHLHHRRLCIDQAFLRRFLSSLHYHVLQLGKTALAKALWAMQVTLCQWDRQPLRRRFLQHQICPATPHRSHIKLKPYKARRLIINLCKRAPQVFLRHQHIQAHIRLLLCKQQHRRYSLFPQQQQQEPQHHHQRDQQHKLHPTQQTVFQRAIRLHTTPMLLGPLKFLLSATLQMRPFQQKYDLNITVMIVAEFCSSQLHQWTWWCHQPRSNWDTLWNI